MGCIKGFGGEERGEITTRKIILSSTFVIKIYCQETFWVKIGPQQSQNTARECLCLAVLAISLGKDLDEVVMESLLITE